MFPSEPLPSGIQEGAHASQAIQTQLPKRGGNARQHSSRQGGPV